MRSCMLKYGALTVLALAGCSGADYASRTSAGGASSIGGASSGGAWATGGANTGGSMAMGGASSGGAPGTGGVPVGTGGVVVGTGGVTVATGGVSVGTGGVTVGTGGVGVGTGGVTVGTGGVGTGGVSVGTGGNGTGGDVVGSGGDATGGVGTGGATGGAGTGGGGTGNVECVLPDLPDAGSLPDLGVKLPDPFTFYDGTKVTTKAQWECRRQEILAMAAKYLYGPVPGDCDEVSGSVNGGNVSISCTVGGNTQSFSASISGSGEAIALDLSAGIFPSPHKTLSLGSGNDAKIRTLYGLSELNPNIANGWMINRVMDVLEQNPGSGHDPTKIVVSGCSGCGKGAFLAGVFSRVPIVVIVESGGGGGTSWRMTEWFTHGAGQSRWNCSDRPQGIDVLEDNGICGPWVTSAASSFRSNPSTVNNMPFDQHMLLATIAPRYLVHFTNSNFSWCWLAGTSEALASWAAHSVYNALGVPENHSFEVYDGGHCGVGDTGIAAAMFDRAINGNMSADTGKININDNYMQVPVSEWEGLFIDWDMNTVLQ
jgi:hypothetical protein